MVIGIYKRSFSLYVVSLAYFIVGIVTKLYSLVLSNNIYIVPSIVAFAAWLYYFYWVGDFFRGKKVDKKRDELLTYLYLVLFLISTIIPYLRLF